MKTLSCARMTCRDIVSPTCGDKASKVWRILNVKEATMLLLILALMKFYFVFFGDTARLFGGIAIAVIVYVFFAIYRIAWIRRMASLSLRFKHSYWSAYSYVTGIDSFQFPGVALLPLRA